jgi:hypothetical protein
MAKKEIRVKLDAREGQVNFTTAKIIGSLNSVVIDSPDEVEVIVESELDYLIFKRKVKGIEYLAPRARIIPSEDNMVDRLTFDKFKLNEKLIITVIGANWWHNLFYRKEPVSSKVNMIFRFD